MRTIAIKSIILVLFLNFFIPPNCPPGGKDSHGVPLTGSDAAFNRRKNRSIEEPDPLEVKAKTIHIADLQYGGTHAVKDRDRWKEGTFVEIDDAYLIEPHPGGKETCNCFAKDPQDRDIHINLGSKKDLTVKNNNVYVIVEITPKYKHKHEDYQQKLAELTGRKVKVRGYLFYDWEHERNSTNYCQTCSGVGVWRKTCWEIHPVTYIGLSN
jgi:hypothetical protein